MNRRDVIVSRWAFMNVGRKMESEGRWSCAVTVSERRDGRRELASERIEAVEKRPLIDRWERFGRLSGDASAHSVLGRGDSTA